MLIKKHLAKNHAKEKKVIFRNQFEQIASKGGLLRDTIKTGILFFTVSATKEARRKTWHPDFDVNLKIANHLISSTRKKLVATGISIIEIKENQQRGSSFGSKLSQTITR